MTKTHVFLLVIAAIVLSLTACSSPNEEPTPEELCAEIVPQIYPGNENITFTGKFLFTPEINGALAEITYNVNEQLALDWVRIERIVINSQWSEPAQIGLCHKEGSGHMKVYDFFVFQNPQWAGNLEEPQMQSLLDGMAIFAIPEVQQRAIGTEVPKVQEYVDSGTIEVWDGVSPPTCNMAQWINYWSLPPDEVLIGDGNGIPDIISAFCKQKP